MLRHFQIAASIPQPKAAAAQNSNAHYSIQIFGIHLLTKKCHKDAPQKKKKKINAPYQYPLQLNLEPRVFPYPLTVPVENPRDRAHRHGDECQQ